MTARHLIPVVALAALPMLCSLASAAPPLGLTTRGRVINVVDGDTVDVEIKHIVRVRLIDCWSPEIRSKNAQEKQRGLLARQYMQSITDGKDCTLHIPTTGTLSDALTLDRALGRLWVDGFDEDVSQLMVEMGYATRKK